MFYFDSLSGIDKELVNHFKDTILTDLQALEDYFNIFKLSLPNLNKVPNYCVIEQEIDDDFLRLIIIYNAYGIVNYKVDILESIDKEDLYHREWLD